MDTKIDAADALEGEVSFLRQLGAPRPPLVIKPGEAKIAEVEDAIVAHRTVLKTVANYYQIAEASVLQANRGKGPVALARQVAMYLMRTILGLSYPAIGALLGRDHTSVLHGHNAVATERLTNTTLNLQLERLEEALKPLQNTRPVEEPMAQRVRRALQAAAPPAEPPLEPPKVVVTPPDDNVPKPIQRQRPEPPERTETIKPVTASPLPRARKKAQVTAEPVVETTQLQRRLTSIMTGFAEELEARIRRCTLKELLDYAAKK